jgi:hypothetical protein
MGSYLFGAVVFGVGIAHETNHSFTLYKEGRVIRGRVTHCFVSRSVGSVGVFHLFVCRDVRWDHGLLGVGMWCCCCHEDGVGSVFVFVVVCTAPLVFNSFMMPGWRSWHVVLAQASVYAALPMCPPFFRNLQNGCLQRPKAWPQQRVDTPLREGRPVILFLQWSKIKDREGLFSPY